MVSDFLLPILVSQVSQDKGDDLEGPDDVLGPQGKSVVGEDD